MPERSDEELDKLLSKSLPSPPASWVSRAEDLPRLERALARLDGLTGEPTDDDVRAALQAAGLVPDQERIQAVAWLRGQQTPR